MNHPRLDSHSRLDRGSAVRKAAAGVSVALASLALFGCSAVSASSYNPISAQSSVPAAASRVAAASQGTGTATSATSAAVATTASRGIIALDSTPVAASDGQLRTEANATITLGPSIAVSGQGATVTGNVVSITAAGSYLITGSVSDGQIVVDTKDKESVILLLNGASITSATSAPIYVKDAKAVSIVLVDGSKNFVADGTAYTLADPEQDEPNATIFSKANITISGNGALAVDANYNDAIASKDALEITAGIITLDSVADGIRGKDSLIVRGGNITVNAAGDGLKATGEVAISGGTITIDSADDAIHANGTVLVKAGKIAITAGDDGVHADSALRVDGGQIDITRSYEGIESSVITFNDGTIHVVASDDAVNASSGSGGTEMAGGPGMGVSSGTSSNRLEINGGYIVVDSGGDGLDANGSISMTGGTAIVQGPVDGGNGSLDYDDGFKITGGTLITAGSAGMAQAPDTTSSQYSLMVNLPSAQAAGSLIHIATQSGEELVTFRPAKAYQSVVVSSPKLQKGATYVVSTGGDSTGTATDGVYSGGSYSGGAQAATMTVSGVVTTFGSAGGGFQGGMRGVRP